MIEIAHDSANKKNNINNLFIFNILFFSLIYFCTVYSNLYISVASQLGIIFSIFLWFVVVKKKYLDYIVLMVLVFCVFWQGLYAFNLLALYIAYIVSSDLRKKSLFDAVLIYSVVIIFSSVLHFYFLGEFLFNESINYPHYFFDSLYRLIGLDSSPTILSFLAGLCFLIIFMDKRLKAVKKLLLLIFFVFIIFLTASRTVFFGLLFSIIFSRLGRLSFFIIILFLIIFPLLSTLIYIFYEDITVRFFIELITSHRIVNWSNLAYYLSSQNLYNLFFGIGKPPLFDSILFENSETLIFKYVPIRDTESAILKLLVYHGFFSLFFFYYLFKKSLSSTCYIKKAFLSYIVFCSIFYDSIISVQYLFIAILLFVVLRKDDVVLRES